MVSSIPLCYLLQQIQRTKIETTQRAGYNIAKRMVAFDPTSTMSATIVSRVPRRPHILLFARGLDDFHEAARVEAGAANQSAVNIWLAH